IEPEENRFYTYEEFRKNVDSNLVIGGPLDRKTIYGIKTFSTLRNAELIKQIEAGIQFGRPYLFPKENRLSYLWKDKSGILIVHYPSVEKSRINTIKIFDCMGKVLYGRNIDPANSSIELNIKDMPAGVYTIVLNNNEAILTEKLIITK
ncbi:MAG: T9SS type A sorting domain-containing protein, partial [Chitinispirillaceae bacterium]|nr:T9SS type A sorting domain-containing protein [Chitinispirillaceae bacterium]